MDHPPEGTRWQFVCTSCEGSKLAFSDLDDDDAEVRCGICGICGTSFGTWRVVQAVMQNKVDPAGKLSLQPVNDNETKH